MMAKVSTFNQFLEEDVNDPVLMKLRASKHKEAERSKRELERKRLRVTGSRRQRMEEELDEILQEITDLKIHLKDLYSEMEMDAGQRDEPYEPGQQDKIEKLVSLGLADQSNLRNTWTDDDANQHGDQLNKVEDEIERLTKQAQDISRQLDY